MKKTVVEATNWVAVWLALIAALGTGFGSWLTYRANTIHTAVNSERTKTTEEIKHLNEVITDMAGKIAALAERKKGK